MSYNDDWDMADFCPKDPRSSEEIEAEKALHLRCESIAMQVAERLAGCLGPQQIEVDLQNLVLRRYTEEICLLSCAREAIETGKQIAEIISREIDEMINGNGYYE